MIELKEKDRFTLKEKLQNKEIRVLLNNVKNKIDRIIDKYNGDFIHTCTYNDKYYKANGFEWTKGFYTGIIWYLYLYTQDECYKKLALKQCLELGKEAKMGHEGIKNHDVGFIYSLSTIAGYMITGDEKLLEISRQATDVLTERFLSQCGVIQAWGKIGEEGINNGRIIIDTFMNLPILYKMSEFTGDKKYHDVALKHLDNACKVLVRDDFTTYHTYYFDTKSGKPLYGKTHQGKNDDSMWARGQAWGVYGLALSYKYNPERKDLLEKAKNLLNVFLNKLPSDLVCPWDFDYDDYMYVLKDASTMPIIVSGILELLKYDIFTKEEHTFYEKVAHNLLKALLENDFISQSNDKTDGLVKHSVYAFPNKGLNECVLWGDYFYVECLMRLFTQDRWLFW